MDEKKQKPKITPTKNGPLKVTGLDKFTNSRYEPITTKKTMFLCRCGESKTKPFCDGSHLNTGFSDEKQDWGGPDKRDNYKGKNITIHDNRGICAHSGHCTGNLASVFRMGTEPWIVPDGEKADTIKKVIDMCPSGALSYSVGDKEYSDREADPEIHVCRNGPYQVKGGIELEGQELGEGASREHYTLCRCGKSRNKPRCDGSHWYAAFKDDEALTISSANRARGKTEPQWELVADLNELKEGQTKKLLINNQQIVLSLVNGKYGAIDGRCPHQGGPLIDGTIDKGVIRCPWHGHAFNPVTGKALGKDSDVKAFHVEERADGIYLLLSAKTRSEWTVSHVMVETMVNWGVKHVFGMVGHSNLGLAEAIRVQEEKGKVTYIGIRHEGAASFACSGYAKVSGRPAACMTIAGPGATNLLTGLWDAKMDRVPVLALTGQVNTQFFGPGAFQEIDLPSAFDAVSVFSQTVLPSSDHGSLMSLALKNAIVQRNVAHLIFPDEVQHLDAGDSGPDYPDGRVSDTKITPPKRSIDLALYRISRAKRPVFIAGYGARESMGEIITLAEKLNAPVLTTFKGKGQISDHHPLGCGVLGRSGTPVASWFMNRSDLLIVFGASFSHHTGIDASKPLIQVDFERMALGKFHPVDTPIWGEAGITSALLSDNLPAQLECINCRNEIAEHWKMWREEKERRAAIENKRGINSATIFASLNRQAPENALFCVDVGNNTYSFGRYYESQDNRVILSGYLGSIGFAFPASMGAWFAQNERPVISISGDGGFAQYMGEFNTAVKYGMDITHILLNNGELGKISKEQRDENLNVWQTSLHNPVFSEYAKQCGGFGIKVEKPEKLDAVIKEALAYKGPSLVEIISA
jgi:thiamine pyrophosphate-dependent acetolactate synthase large subunit-like protein/CDGSH-type Zn-finger protein/nitrite reductase/ring-hydroxylating ferredoxin subunit